MHVELGKSTCRERRMQTKCTLRRRGYKTRKDRERVQRHLKHHEKNVSHHEKNFSHHEKGFYLNNPAPSHPFPLALAPLLPSLPPPVARGGRACDPLPPLLRAASCPPRAG